MTDSRRGVETSAHLGDSALALLHALQPADLRVSTLRRTRILTFAPYYLPGYRAGGPIRSLANLVEMLGDEMQFHIVTQDHDVGGEPYAGIQPDAWQDVGKARVLYASPAQTRVRRLAQLVATTRADVLYLNSFFAPVFTARILMLRAMGSIPPLPCIVACRGELDAGALSLKRLKKRAYIALARTAGLYRGVVWQATSAAEAKAILARYPAARRPPSRIIVAPNVSCHATIAAPGRTPRPPAKRAGVLRAVFVSRVSRMKNLDFVLRLFGSVRGNVQFDVYGTIEDPRYWRECIALMRSLPTNVVATYRGELPHEDVPAVLGQAELLVLPTRGENFGHVILEALAAGCPVLVSDRTPWRDLQPQRAGWDVSLSDAGAFRSAIAQVLAMDNEEFSQWRAGARAVAVSVAESGNPVEQHRKLFRAARETGNGIHTGSRNDRP